MADSRNALLHQLTFRHPKAESPNRTYADFFPDFGRMSRFFPEFDRMSLLLEPVIFSSLLTCFLCFSGLLFVKGSEPYAHHSTGIRQSFPSDGFVGFGIPSVSPSIMVIPDASICARFYTASRNVAVIPFCFRNLNFGFRLNFFRILAEFHVAF